MLLSVMSAARQLADHLLTGMISGAVIVGLILLFLSIRFRTSAPIVLYLAIVAAFILVITAQDAYAYVIAGVIAAAGLWWFVSRIKK